MIVSCVQGTPEAGITFEIVAVATLNTTALDQTPPCCTRAVPDTELPATAAITCVSPRTHHCAIRCCPPTPPRSPGPVRKPEPVAVTGTPATPDVGETFVMVGTPGSTVNTNPATVTTTLPVVQAISDMGENGREEGHRKQYLQELPQVGQSSVHRWPPPNVTRNSDVRYRSDQE